MNIALFLEFFALTAPLRSYFYYWSEFLQIFKIFQETLLSAQVELARVRPEVIFHCRNSYRPEPFEINLLVPEFFNLLNSTLPLAFILHGWQDDGESDYLKSIQNNWVKYQHINVCTVDWGTMAHGNYKRSMLSIFDVGLTISNLVLNLESFGFTPDNVTLVGYSLGAHAAGFAGKLLNGTLKEIIGLDPAGPLFSLPSDVGIDYRLDQSDAQFVQVLHTAGGTLGTSLKCGHADFYPNGGVSPQTNCVFTKFTDEPNTNPVGCSHSMAAKYFEISMNPEYRFSGWHCSGYRSYIFGLCRFKRQTRFGIHSERIPGNYFFTTEVSHPYVQRRKVWYFKNYV